MDNKRAKYNLDIFERLPIRAKELLFEEDFVKEELFEEIDCMIEDMKSPIEQLLLIAMIIYFKKNNIILFVDFQKEINIKNKKYIADFYIGYDSYINYFLDKKFKLVIECDGYEYHHSNKEQVEKDYKRENDLKLNGYDVIRFTGSNIYKNPTKCAEEIIDYVKFKAKR